MAKILKGAPVSEALWGTVETEIGALREKGITPVLAIIRIGAREDDISYEQSAKKKCAAVGIEIKSVALPADASQAELLSAIDAQNNDAAIHGMLLMRPLPAGFDETAACAAIKPEKDVDGAAPSSLVGVFSNTDVGFPPCTAYACVEILKYYGIAISGKRAVIAGRSLTVGRSAAMLLLHENATVTLCHRHTEDLPSVVRGADIVIAAAGSPKLLGAGCFAPGQVIVDVGTNWDEDSGKLVGDVDFDAAERIVAAITPVPGGVGAVTTAILAMHVAKAAARQNK